MRVLNRFNHMVKEALTVGVIVAGAGSAQAAEPTAIDPFRFCTNSCNDRCNDAKDPLAPKLKAQCQEMCAGNMDQVASLQMSKMTGDKGKEFRQARGQAKVDMMQSAPIYRCLAKSAAPSEAPMKKRIPKIEELSAAQMASAQRAAAAQRPSSTPMKKTDTRSAAQRESDENYERSQRAAAVQKSAEAGVQSDASQDINQDIQNLKEAISDVAAKLDALGEKINSAQGQ